MEDNFNIFLSQVTGKLLGDGSITKQHGRKPRFQFIHRVEDLDWTTHCYENLTKYIPLNPPKYKRIIDSRLVKGYSESYFVQSKTCNVITNLESIWYQDRYKRLPLDFIAKHLNEEALAWWYQDDGHLKLNNQTPQKIVLSTDNFTTKEVVALSDILNKKFLLHFKRDGQNRLLLYDQPQIYYFLKLVEPYLHPCMRRKIIPASNLSFQQSTPKRTTIYLPEQFIFNRPTKEINDIILYTKAITPQLFNRKNFINFYSIAHSLIKSYSNFKAYQIIISAENRKNLNLISHLTGWNKSQIAFLCLANKIKLNSKH